VKRATAAALAAIVLVLVAGCGVVDAMLDAEDALERLGFTDVSVGLEHADGIDIVTVSYGTGPGETQAGRDQAAASVIWETVPYRFDRLVIDGRAYGRFQLEEQFGARDPSLDERTIGDEFERVGLRVLGVFALVAFLVVVAVVVVVVLIVRANRRRRQQLYAVWDPHGGRLPDGQWAPPR
jgi:hypothetical protein